MQCSSIMPQKRNPVALEHARAIGSKALGQALARSCSRSTTRRSATSSTPRTICSRWCSRCSAMPSARCGWWRPRWRPRVRHGAHGAARRGGLDHRDRAGRHAGPRSRRAVQGRPRDRVAPGREPAGGPAAPLSSALRDGLSSVLGAPVELDDATLARVLSPRHFVERAHDARRPGAVGDRARDRRRRKRRSDRTMRAGSRTRDGSGLQQAAQGPLRDAVGVRSERGCRSRWSAPSAARDRAAVPRSSRSTSAGP